MPISLSRARHPLYLHCYRKAFETFERALSLYRQHDSSGAVYELYGSLEFSWKTLCLLAQGGHPPHHLPTKVELESMLDALREFMSTDQSSSWLRVFENANPTWGDNPNDRIRSLYGDAGDKSPPNQLFPREKAKAFGDDVELTILPTLAQIQRKVLTAGPVPIGVLDGKFSEDALEIPCSEAAWADYFEPGPRTWARHITSGGFAATCEKICMLGVSNQFAAILNPFGETFPDSSFPGEVLPGFERVRSFVFAGGVFVTLGGHPFHRVWDVQTGKISDTSLVVPNVPTAIEIHFDRPEPHVAIRSTTVVNRLLAANHFGLHVMWDAPSRNGPVVVTPYQLDDDKHLWSAELTTSLRAYRAIDPRPHLIPFVRAKIQDQEIYLAAAAPYGFGFLVHIGLDLSKGRDTEASLATRPVLDGVLARAEMLFERTRTTPLPRRFQ